METNNKRESYQSVLLDRCATWWDNYEKSTAGDQLIKFEWHRVLYDFVKAVALESFKNGVAAGERKAHRHGRQQGDTHRAPDQQS